MPVTNLTDTIRLGKAAITEHISSKPTYETVCELVNALVELATQEPENVLVYTRILADQQVPPITLRLEDASISKCDSFKGFLREVLNEVLEGSMDPPNASIDPSNHFLIIAMLSGACANTGLCAEAAQASQVLLGLQILEDYEAYGSSDLYEIRAIHACLQLLVGGSVLLYDDGAQEVENALKVIEEKGVITNPNGRKLLNVRPDSNEGDLC